MAASQISDEQENDLEISYTSSSSSGDLSGRTVLQGAGLGHPIRRDEWGRTGTLAFLLDKGLV